MRAVKQGTLCVLAIAASAAAMAGTVHHVRFAQPAQILVWEAGTLIARGDRIELSSLSRARSKDLLGAGTLVPAGETRNQSIIIEVASNTAFSLASDDADPAQGVVVEILGVRENAQLHPVQTSESLFRQSAKTAVRRGPPLSQAIELEISWSGEVPPNLILAAD